MANLYFDHHTATFPYDACQAAMSALMQEQLGSPSSPHRKGEEALKVYQSAEKKIAAALSLRMGENFSFFSSGSEAIAHLHRRHYFDCVRQSGKTHLLTSTLEEAPMLNSLNELEELGCTVKKLPVNSQGQITQEMLHSALSPRTSFVSLSWANALTGVIHPIEDLAKVCKEAGVSLHVDASHVLGKRYFCFQDLGVDFLTFEGSLIHGPQGTGGLIGKSHLLREASHLNLPGFVGLAAALEESAAHFDHLCLESARLREHFEKSLQREFSDVQVLFAEAERLPNVSCLSFPGVASEVLLYLLNRKGVFASMGGGRTQRLSLLLTACGIEEELAESALSFSLSFATTQEEVDAAIAIVIEAVQQLKRCSQFI